MTALRSAGKLRLLPPSPLRTIVLLALLAGAVACSSDEAGGTTVGVHDDRRPSPPPVIPVPGVPYQPTTVLSDGWIAGSVRLAGMAPVDSVVRPTVDRQVCGVSFVDQTVALMGDGLGDAIVWLADARTGTALPMARRFEVTQEKCLIEPRVQAVVAGGTLNVRSRDALVHRLRIQRHGSGETLVRFLHNDVGQVVPDDRVLARPGLLELRSDLHPWARGFVAVFDHPYFTVTPPGGGFRLEQVPPGTYTLVAWHERFGTVSQPVTVGAGMASMVTITFAAPTAAADSTAGG